MIAVAVPVDCEAFHAAWPQQPVNTWSALAFAAAGVVIAFGGANRLSTVFGAAVTLVGVGSVMFHEGDSDLGAWAHDWAIGALLVVLGLSGGLQGRRVSIGSAVLAAIALLYALTPSSGEWVNGALAIIVVAREARVRHLRRRAQFRLAVRLAAVGGLLTLLGRTGGPWCSPESTFQPHAAWHVLAAAALVSYAASRNWFRPSEG